MEIKVKCVCGSVYSFEETPVDGRLSFPVSCTNCGADGTEKAHAYIAAQLAPQGAAKAKSTGRFGFGRKKDEVAGPEVTVDKQIVDGNAAAETGDETSPLRLILAGLGALLVGLAGAYGWCEIAKYTGFEFGLVAWILGGLVGGVSALLAPKGHYWLGAVAAVAAVIAISGGEFLVAKWFVGKGVDIAVTKGYQLALEYSKSAATAESGEPLREAVAQYKLVQLVTGAGWSDPITTYQTYQVDDSDLAFLHIIHPDRKIITFKQRGAALSGELVKPDEIEQFQAKVQPALKALANGKPSKEEYRATLRAAIESQITFRGLFIQSFQPYTLLWVFLGVGTAYKLARNAGLKY